MHPWSAGTQLGPYELLAPLGAGGMGEVWKARDTRLNRTVAIKRLKTAHSARFEQEARAIAALNHPHICQIFDVGPDYLVLEFIDGAPLKGPLSATEALGLARDIAAALEAAHVKGILHRDLKPANVLVAAGGAKLLDFGLAKLVHDSDATQTMGVAGTLLYMSPEQAEGKPLDPCSDIFSFGAVLYELLAGRRAFDSLAAVLRDDPAPLDSPLFAIVKRCLAKKPADRFQSAAELRAACEAVRLTAPASAPSIAVLPFANMSGDKEQEYFSDGLADEIINALVKIPGLKVIARTSAFAFKGQNTDIRKIAETLGVAHILEGSVRRSGNRIRVTAQLITAADGSHLWSERFDRELADVFEVQDEISAAIVKALQSKLTPQAAAPQRYTPKLAAHEALLKARHLHWLQPPTADAMVRAGDFYKQSVEIDPQYALAHTGYADYLIGRVVGGLVPARDSVPLARAEAERALQLDPSLPDALAMVGIVASIYDYDWHEAERYCTRAMSDDALSPWIRSICASFFLLATGRMQQAVEQHQRARQADPLHPGTVVSLASSLGASGRFAEAEALARQALDLNPGNIYARLGLALNFIGQARYPEALSQVSQLPQFVLMLPRFRGILGGLLGRTGEQSRAADLLRELAASQAPGTAYGLFFFHLITGDLTQAAAAAEHAIEEREPGITAFFRGIGSPLRESPHWPRLARMMNLPEFAQ